ncbi:MAG: hypothetical protein L6R28_02915 [Planctomycetes bacterium]|nr:hypothetical protein [Planctomycetota bacterium]
MMIQNAVIFLEEFTGKEKEVLVSWIESIAEPQLFTFKEKRKYFLAQGDYIFRVEDVNRFGLKGSQHAGNFGAWFRAVKYEFDESYAKVLSDKLGPKYQTVLCFTIALPVDDRPPNLFFALLLELTRMFRGPIMVTFDLSTEDTEMLKNSFPGYITAINRQVDSSAAPGANHIVSEEFIKAYTHKL